MPDIIKQIQVNGDDYNIAAKYDDNENEISSTYQQKLTAGSGIRIENNVISVDLPNAEDNAF